MKKLTIDNFKFSLSEVIPTKDDVVFITSGLWSFAKFMNLPTNELPAKILEAILEVVDTGKRTLVLPSSNWDFCGKGEFDVDNSPSQVGIISELFRKYPGVKRTLSPINAYCVKGPRQDEFFNTKNVTLWGCESQMGWLDKVNARMVKVGVGWEYLPYLHRIEEELMIPYRYFKTFSGHMLHDGIREQVSETMFVRVLEVDVFNQWDALISELNEKGKITKSSIEEFKIESSTARDILDTGVKIGRMDPFAFVKNHDTIKKWVDEHGQEKR